MTDPTVAHARCPDTPAQQAQERTTRGMLLYNRERGRIHRLQGDVWAVPSSQGGYWRVDLAAVTCPCPDFLYACTDQDTGRALMQCKHLAAASIAVAKGRAQDHPHACLNGYIYLGYTAFDEETGE